MARFLLPTIWFALCAMSMAQVQSGRELVRLPASQTIHDIAINSTVATTITFPEKITLLTGYGLVTDPTAANQLSTGNNPVAVVHYENVLSDTLVVRLIKPGEPCHATIRTARALYLMRFTPSEAANLAVIVPPPTPATAASEVGPEVVAQNRLKYSSDELVGMLGKARNRKALQPLNPGLYSGWLERNGLEMTSTKGQLFSTIYEIQRHPDKDLTVFRCWLANKGTDLFEYDPKSVKIRVGERSYDAQLVDAAPEVRAGQTIPLDLVLQGGPGGSREGISINQDFRIELPEPGRRDVIDPTLFGDTVAEGK
jgi:hypothetical protein